MAAISIQVPYPVFYDRDGLPLDNGRIYIGDANQDPITNPLATYYDEALTIPAAQPLITSAGYIYRNGTPAQIYVDANDFSISVYDNKNLFVYSFPSATGIGVDAASIEYDPPFPGAVTSGYTVADKLSQSVSVQDFGAVGDGVTDDTAAFDAAIATQKAVFVPRGTYKVSKFAAIDFDGFCIFGEGPDSSVIVTNDTTNDLFTFGDGVTLIYSPEIRDLSFETSVTKTAGYLVAVDKVFGTLIQRVRVNGYFGVCDLYAAQFTTLRDIHAVLMTPNTGKMISARSDGTSSNLIIDNFQGDGGPGTQPYAGLYVEEWDGVFIYSSQFNRAGNALVFAPPAGTNFDHMFCVNSSFDTCTGNGIVVSDNGGTTRRVRFSNSWTGSHGNNGIYVEDGAQLNGFSFADGWIVSNNGNGVYFANSVTDFHLEGTVIAGNGKLNPDTYSGIYVDDSTSPISFENFQIIGCKIGLYGDFIDSQKYGFEVKPLTGPEFNQFVVVGNDFTGNLSGAVSFALSSFPANRMVTGNVGFVTEATGTATQLAANSSVTVTHGCAFTPTAGDIVITASTAWGNANRVWVANITTTTFDIVTDAAPSSGNIGWGWKVNIQ